MFERQHKEISKGKASDMWKIAF